MSPYDGKYNQYPKYWALRQNPALYGVRVPQELDQIDYLTYRQLMQERLMWVIRQEMMSDEGDLKSAHSQLIRYTNQTVPEQITPDLPGDMEDPTDIDMWLNDWAQAIVEGNLTFQEKLAMEALETVDGLVFPVTPIDETHLLHSEYLEAHDEMGLEEWLNSLTYLML